MTYLDFTKALAGEPVALTEDEARLVQVYAANRSVPALRKMTGLNRTDFSRIFGIPTRSLENWERDDVRANAAPYVADLLAYAIITSGMVTVPEFHYLAKAKAVRGGKSKVFKSWHEAAGISMDDFLDGLAWLCSDPMTDGKLTRELGCERSGNLVRLRRVYYDDGSFAGFYQESDGHIWGHTADCASISAHDRV